MLILNRKVKESIVICQGKDEIIITLLQMKNGQTKLGIAAPKTIPVHRKEVYERIQKNKNDNTSDFN